MNRVALVIDDSRMAADVLTGMLGLLGYSARAAYGSRAALEGMTRQFPDVILLDIHMPGLDGVEVCRFLRRDPRLAHVPVIAMSSETQAPLVRRILEAGADVFLPKPITLDALEQALRRIVK